MQKRASQTAKGKENVGGMRDNFAEVNQNFIRHIPDRKSSYALHPTRRDKLRTHWSILPTEGSLQDTASSQKEILSTAFRFLHPNLVRISFPSLSVFFC